MPGKTGSEVMSMYCLAILDSGNFAFNLCRILEGKGYFFEVISTPCHIAKGGCGYCIKLPFKYKDVIIKEGKESNNDIKEIYKVNILPTKNTYEKIY